MFSFECMMDYKLIHHTHEESCNCPKTLRACNKRSLKRKISDMEYMMLLRNKEVQKLETEVWAARIECQKLCTSNNERALENNNLLNKN